MTAVVLFDDFQVLFVKLRQRAATVIDVIKNSEFQIFQVHLASVTELTLH